MYLFDPRAAGEPRAVAPTQFASHHSAARTPASKRHRPAAAPLFVLTLGVGLAGCASRAAPGPLVTDRPDFTESTRTVAPGHAQLEAGYTRSSGEAVISHQAGEVLLRLGATAGTELRVGLGSWRVEDPEAGETTTGVDGASIGVKLRLPPVPVLEEAALLLGTTVPVSSTFGNLGWSPFLLLAGAWGTTLADIGTNVGYAHSETVHGTGELLASVAAGFPMSDRISAFLEVYGTAALGGSVQATGDAGFTVAVTRNAQIDLRLGRRLSGATETVVGVGIAVRR